MTSAKGVIRHEGQGVCPVCRRVGRAVLALVLVGAFGCAALAEAFRQELRGRTVVVVPARSCPVAASIAGAPCRAQRSGE